MDDDMLGAVCAADLAALGAQAPVDEVQAVGTDLVRRWQEPHRAYHTLRHLAELLVALSDLAAHGEVTAADVVRLRVAAWYHDAVYDPAATAGANEEASAVLVVEQLDRLGFDLADIEAVASLVAATATHEWGGTEPVGSAAAFLDADLWILAAPVDRYDEYVTQIRAEHALVPGEAFRAGRSELLTGLTARPHLYLTGHARAAWESAARANVHRELARPA